VQGTIGALNFRLSPEEVSEVESFFRKPAQKEQAAVS
jgi:hypothetical protein